MDTTKNQQAVEIIAAQIAKIPANIPMDFGTLGNQQGLTKRDGEARKIAAIFVKKAYGMDVADRREDDQERIDLVNSIANAATAKVGK